LKSAAEAISDDDVKSERALLEIGERLRALLRKLQTASHRFCVVGDSAANAEVIAQIRERWSAQKTSLQSPLRGAAKKPVENTTYTIATGVNYCALVFPTVPLAHDDAAALAVACRYLTHVFLHPKLREQGGAYGGSSNYQGDSGVVSLTSYRDPRLADTFRDMRDSLAELAKIPDDERLLREAILGVIAMIDTPASPAGEAKTRWISDLKGLGPDRINALRKRILATTCADLRRAAQRWLDPNGGVAAAVTSAEAAKAIGWRTEAI
jgi:Zn-dependent M16 (insulinase) family peptidase